jgi:hypothetical protein
LTRRAQPTSPSLPTLPRSDVVAFLFPRLQAAGRLGQGIGQFRGVCYPDDAAGCWVVADPSGRRLPLLESPVPEADTFVVFDDARCRGADLKVRRGARPR